MLMISVVISTYNRAETLRRTIESMFFLRYPLFEVIVVNGPSTDGTEAMLAEYADAIRIIHCPQRNLSKSRNMGIAGAAGDIIAFIDDDAIPEPDWLDQLSSLYKDPKTAAVGGFIRDHTGVRYQAKYVVADLFGRGEPFETLEQADCDETVDGERFFSLTGTNSSFRRSALLRIGGFDEVFEYFLDETDVNLRLVKSGFRSAVAPQAEVHHKYAASHLRSARKVPRDMLPVCRSVAYFAIVHALPRYGWERIREYLIQYESAELVWKSGNLSAGDISTGEFTDLVYGIKKGIRDGVAQGVNYRPPTRNDHVERYATSSLAKPMVVKRRTEDRLRLCMLSQDEGSPTPGGIGRWTSTVAAGLAKRGHEVSVMGRSVEGGDTVDFVQSCYWRHLVAHRPLPTFMDDLGLGLPTSISEYCGNVFAEANRVSRRRQFSVISGPIWDVEPAAFIAASHIPTCLSLHTTAAIALKSKPEWRENSNYYHQHVKKVIAAEKTALKRASLILANSHAVIKDIESLYDIKADDRFHVIPHGIEDVPPKYRTHERREASGRLKILFVGRLEARKGVGPLVSAIDALLSGGTDVDVDFVGSGSDDVLTELVQSLQAKHYPRVRHHGFVSDADLETFYANADIFVAPSTYESFGLILIEAMRYGTACLSTSVGGIPEIIDDGISGLLVAPDDAMSLKNALSTLCSDQDLRRRLGSVARERYEAMFTAQIMVERLEAFYSKAAELTPRLLS